MIIEHRAPTLIGVLTNGRGSKSPGLTQLKLTMPRRRNLRQQRSPSPEPEAVEETKVVVDDDAPDAGPSKLNEAEPAAVTDGEPGEAKAHPALEVLYCEGAYRCRVPSRM
jgi:hypothetical protein